MPKSDVFPTPMLGHARSKTVTLSKEKLAEFRTDFRQAMSGLHEMMFRGVVECQDPPNDHVRRFLTHGVGRRLSILKRSIEEIFTIFPPERDLPLSNDEAVSLQIHLHAFLINLAGVSTTGLGLLSTGMDCAPLCNQLRLAFSSKKRGNICLSRC